MLIRALAALLLLSGGAWATPALDGTATNHAANSSSLAATLTTTLPHSAIIVEIFTEALQSGTTTISGVSGAGLGAFTKLTGATTQYVSGGGAPIEDRHEVWWKPSPSALAGEVITVTLSGSTCNVHIHAYGVSGAFNYAAPFDSDPSMPISSGSATPSPVLTVSTMQRNDLLGWGSGGSGAVANLGPPTPGPSWNTIADTIQPGGCLLTSRFTTFSKSFSGLLPSQAFVASNAGPGVSSLIAVTASAGHAPNVPLMHAPLVGFR